MAGRYTGSYLDRLDGWRAVARECATRSSDLVLGVKDKILTIDLPHELRAKFNSLFKLLFGLAL